MRSILTLLVLIVTLESSWAQQVQIENDVRIPMRDGSYLMANVYRPSNDLVVPAIVTLGPYGKDRLPWRPEGEDGDVKVSELAAFETPDPGWWVPHGYAVVRIDARGLGKSPGKAGVFPTKEREDYYDAIEWIGTQKWCNGSVGLLGISYYAVNQWHVAAEQPPHLKAIIPWEGFTDPYRDAAYHGGIPSDAFIKHWFKERIHGNTHDGTTGVEPFDLDAMAHDLNDGYYQAKSVDLSKINVPIYAVASWGAHGLHLRGTINGFLESASKHKWLRVHGGIKLEDYYAAQSQDIQRRFFDYFLKGEDNSFDEEPRIRLAIRRSKDEVTWREVDSWPLKNTQWSKFYFDAGTMDIQATPPPELASVTYKGRKPFMRSSGVVFDSQPVTTRTEITGPAAARLWVSSTVEDMDVFIALRIIDDRGKTIRFYGEDTTKAPAAQGWLRVSHRKIDPDRSQPYQPWHVHDEKMPLTPGEIVPIDVEIWPTSFVLEKGWRLRVEILPHDPKGIGDIRHLSTINHGENTIYTGGERESYIVLPVIK